MIKRIVLKSDISCLNESISNFYEILDKEINKSLSSEQRKAIVNDIKEQTNELVSLLNRTNEDNQVMLIILSYVIEQEMNNLDK